MTLDEFKVFWNKLTNAYPWDFKSEESRKVWARAFVNLPLAPALRSIRTYAETHEFKEAPTPEYLAYLTRDCNGMPDLLYKAVQRMKNERNKRDS